jgi:hypothetical protein
MRFVRLAHYLVMYLRTGGDVDNNVGLQRGLATQAPIVGESAPQAVILFGFTPCRQVFAPGHDVVFGEFAFGDGHLATATKCAPAADRVEIDAEISCRIE